MEEFTCRHSSQERRRRGSSKLPSRVPVGCALQDFHEDYFARISRTLDEGQAVEEVGFRKKFSCMDDILTVLKTLRFATKSTPMYHPSLSSVTGRHSKALVQKPLRQFPSTKTWTTSLARLRLEIRHFRKVLLNLKRLLACRLLWAPSLLSRSFFRRKWH